MIMFVYYNLHAKLLYFFDICKYHTKKKDIRADVFCVLPGTRTLDPLIKREKPQVNTKHLKVQYPDCYSFVTD